eukprot:scaffold2316_cov135-Skeletonema_menzelii.AAC.11
MLSSRILLRATTRNVSRRSQWTSSILPTSSSSATTSSMAPNNISPSMPQSYYYDQYNSDNHSHSGSRRSYTTTSWKSMPIKTIDVPTMGDSITEGTIVDIPVAPGDYVNVDDVVIVLETDKVSVDIRASENGAVVEIHGEVDDVVEVGSPLYRLDTDAEAPAGGGGSGGGGGGGGGGEASKVEETPAAAAPEPTVTAAAAAPPPPAATPAAAPVAPPTPPPPSTPQLNVESITTTLGTRPERRSKMSRMRQRVASRLKESQNTAAMLTTFQEVDMGNFMEMRVRHKDEFEKKHGAREGTLALDDMTGGTFTISNGGVFGSLMGTPIINQPQSAILGMHATKMRAVVDEKGNVVARPMMYLALTYDHRLIDGREGVTFLKSVADKITDPARLVFDI